MARVRNQPTLAWPWRHLAETSRERRRAEQPWTQYSADPDFSVEHFLREVQMWRQLEAIRSDAAMAVVAKIGSFLFDKEAMIGPVDRVGRPTVSDVMPWDPLQEILDEWDARPDKELFIPG